MYFNHLVCEKLVNICSLLIFSKTYTKERSLMERETMLSLILDSYPYPILFVDCDHIIRYMNKRAEYHYYQERGYRDLIWQIAI